MKMLRSQNFNLSGWAEPDNTYNALSVRGSYHPFRFVVGLRTDMHDLLDKHPGGIFKSGTDDLALLDAFSTYFHESVHWWQHIGSTTGLLLSLSPPIQTHCNYAHLKTALEQVGPRKPLIKMAPKTFPLEIEQNINRIVNNFYDLEFNRRICLNPLHIEDVIKSPYFESQGHSIEIGLANFLLLIAATFDPDFEVVPHPKQWEETAAMLRNSKVEGFYYGSSVTTAPLGALHIFEGQARFNQLQYLYLTTNGNMSWDEFRKRGMLSEVYVKAFETFLRLSGLKWPSTPIEPEVLLFLLICDLAINPSDGFPFDIRHFESLIESVDPGIRFCWLCTQVAKRPNLLTAIQQCNAEQYIELSSDLCNTLACESPVGIAKELIKWIQKSKGFGELLMQESDSSYPNTNLPVRLCIAKYLRFAEERIRRPEFFCWPAMFFIERPNTNIDLSDSLDIFRKHQPPFLLHPSGEIRPAIFKEVPQANIYATFNDFYYWMMVYDLVHQWITGIGDFNVDYTWMNPLYKPDFSKPFADKAFKETFGVSISEFELLAE